jgi:DNA-binding MarR family transcriptional regulator
MQRKTRTLEPAAERNAQPEAEAKLSTQAAEAFFLHFFTQVNLTSAAVEALGPSGFSLTKHRILGFATLTPGITVGELVRSLRVTHQNLNEPLRRLINEGYIVAKIGEEDRRHKRLFATAKGSRLYRRVIAQQLAMLERAFAAAGPEATRGFLEVQRQLVGETDRDWVTQATRAIAGEVPPAP